MSLGPSGLAIVGAVVVVVSSVGASALYASPVPSALADLPLPVLAADVVPVPPGTLAVPLAGSVPVPITLTLGPTHPARWSAFLSAVDDPASPAYRHFLTYQEYLSEYAPTPAEAAQVLGVLRSAGGNSFTVSPDRVGISTVLSASDVERLFGVTMVQYGERSGVPLYTAVGSVSVPGTLRGLVVGIDGLSDEGTGLLNDGVRFSDLRPVSGSASPDTFVYNVTTSTDWYFGSDYTKAYGATGLFPGSGLANASYPLQEAVATLLASGFNETTGQNLPPWDPKVVDSYFNGTFPAAWPKPTLTGVPVPIGTVVPPAPGSFGAYNDSTFDEYENSLDLEMAGSVAPGVSLYNFYFAGSLLAGNSYVGLADDFAQSLSEALAYNYSPEHLAAISGSFSLPDANSTFWDSELEVAAATGVTVLFASGDQADAPNSLSGRTTGPWPGWPATAAFNSSGDVSVGGVTLTLGGQPTSDFNGGQLNLSYDPSVTGITSLSTWYDAPPGVAISGSEGGSSVVYPEPDWQFHSAAQWPIVNATVKQGTGFLGRAGPDVALAANNTVAAIFANATGTVYLALVEGTSIATPLLAGLVADIVGVESSRSPTHLASLGFVTPELYRIASYYAANPASPGDPFAPVVVGHNYLFSAGPGWNPTTGWGNVNATLLLAADENATVRDYVYTGPTPVLPPPTPAPGIPWTTVAVIVAVGVVIALVLVFVAVVRPSRRTAAPGVPLGATGVTPPPFGPGAQGGIYPGSTFLCPYCGAVRPAEPVRCPRCGAL